MKSNFLKGTVAIPAELYSSAKVSAHLKPPVETRLQELPFRELEWKNFEKLCLRLINREAKAQYCRLYGTPGQGQEGIDIFAKTHLIDTTYRVYQCKKVENFKPNEIAKAVKTFLKGDWASNSNAFILCTTDNLNSTEKALEIENQRSLLEAQGISFDTWDSAQLSVKMKDYPDLVDDFFGRWWVKVFCGAEQFAFFEKNKRLDGASVSEIRLKLGKFYRNLFNRLDPGLPTGQHSTINTLPLEKRYIFPNIVENEYFSSIHFEPLSPTLPDSKLEMELFSSSFEENLRISPLNSVFTLRDERKQRTTYTNPYQQVTNSGVASHNQYHPFHHWLVKADKNLILGPAGSGKSAMLGFIAIDLLGENPQLEELTQKWGENLPVWIPFALWTKLIAHSGGTSPISLEDMLHNWFRSCGEEELWTLVKQALEDKRLLLLVDGLDEWASEQSGRVALQLFELFIEQRNIPALVTSRPHGYQRLGLTSSGWQMGAIAEFSFQQQSQLIQRWFEAWINDPTTSSIESNIENNQTNTESSQITSEGTTRQAKLLADQFMTELTASPDLKELAKVPLLLALLIFLKIYNIRSGLPRNRFKAYHVLVEHLISVHPQKRLVAAQISGNEGKFTNEEKQTLLSHLAYYMQSQPGEGLIESAQALKILEEYLKSDYWGLAPASVRHLARHFLTEIEEVSGLLVKATNQELKFFHRSFQEYLAAVYLTGQSLEEQLRVVGGKANNPQWREIILGLLYLTLRQQEVGRFVEEIKSRKAKVDGNPVHSIEATVLELLLAEITFGEFNCPPSLIRELAEEIFEKIEKAPWFYHRERLLRFALEGLRSAKVRDLVLVRLRRWIPCRIRSRSFLFNAMVNWPPTKEVIYSLEHGLYDEEFVSARAAARTLAKLVGGDKAVGERLMNLAQRAFDPNVRAVALEALLKAWPNLPGIKDVFEDARCSASPQLRFVGIKGCIQFSLQKEEDRKVLLELASEYSSLEDEVQAEIRSLLQKGWPAHPGTKEYCLKIARNPREFFTSSHGSLRAEIALLILLEGFPQDQDVVELCIEELEQEQVPFALYREQIWHLLAQNFRNHPSLVAAIDKWIAKPPKDSTSPAPTTRSLFYQDVRAALIGRTVVAKNALLAGLPDQWPAYVLLEGWGIQDQEVSEALTRIAFGAAKEATTIGHLLPRVILDKKHCRQKLLELLTEPDCHRPDFVLWGLKELNDLERKDATEEVKQTFHENERAIVDKALNLKLNFTDDNDFMALSVSERLLEDYPTDPRIKELAEKEFLHRNGQIGIVGWSYGPKDEKIRQQIIERVCPLPAALREIIAEYLGTFVDVTYSVETDEESQTKDELLGLLADYNQDPDVQAKTQTCISYYKRLVALNTATKGGGAEEKSSMSFALQSLAQLVEDTKGLDGADILTAAWAGAVVLNRLDIHKRLFPQPDETSDFLNGRVRFDEIGFRLPFISIRQINVPLWQLMLENWSKLIKLYGEERFWEHLTNQTADSTWLDNLCLLAETYPQPCRDIISYLENTPEQIIGTGVLKFLSQVQPKSSLLLDSCTKVIAGSSHRNNEQAPIIAAELLGSQFGGDKTVLEWLLTARPNYNLSDACFIALCEGWPNSRELAELLDRIPEDYPYWSYTARFQVLCFSDKPVEKIFEKLQEVLAYAEFDVRYRVLHILRPIVSRLRTDEKTYWFFHHRLMENPTFANNEFSKPLSGSEKITILRLLVAARGMSLELKNWCLKEIGYQMKNGSKNNGFETLFPEIGIDLFTGNLRPVSIALLELLTQTL